MFAGVQGQGDAAGSQQAVCSDCVVCGRQGRRSMTRPLEGSEGHAGGSPESHASGLGHWAGSGVTRGQEEAKGGGRPHGGFFEAYLKSKPACIWSERKWNPCRRQTRAGEGMGSWAPAHLKNGMEWPAGWGQDGQRDRGWPE